MMKHVDFKVRQDVTWHRGLVAGVSSRKRPRIDTETLSLGYEVDKIAKGQSSLRQICYSHFSVIPPCLLVYRRH